MCAIENNGGLDSLLFCSGAWRPKIEWNNLKSTTRVATSPALKPARMPLSHKTQRPIWRKRCFPTCRTHRRIGAARQSQHPTAQSADAEVELLSKLLNWISFPATSGGVKLDTAGGWIPAGFTILLLCPEGAGHYLWPEADLQLAMSLYYLVITASCSEIECEMTRFPREKKLHCFDPIPASLHGAVGRRRKNSSHN